MLLVLEIFHFISSKNELSHFESSIKRNLPLSPNGSRSRHMWDLRTQITLYETQLFTMNPNSLNSFECLPTALKNVAQSLPVAHSRTRDGGDTQCFEGRIRNLHGWLPKLALFGQSKLRILVNLGSIEELGLPRSPLYLGRKVCFVSWHVVIVIQVTYEPNLLYELKLLWWAQKSWFCRVHLPPWETSDNWPWAPKVF